MINRQTKIRFKAAFLAVVLLAAFTPLIRAAGPKIVSSAPEAGAEEVDPAITEIRVTFDRDMGGGMSWTGGGEVFPPIPKDKKPKWLDNRTCVMPVKLEVGRFYRVGINSTGFQNFKSADGKPAAPRVIYFTTKGATDEVKARLQKPMIVSFEPDSGTEDVSAAMTELKITFDAPMGAGMSWVGGGEHFPESPEGREAMWSEDQMTCTLPVILKPGWEYRISLNSTSFNNFQSAWGVPLDPVDYTFQTAP